MVSGGVDVDADGKASGSDGNKRIKDIDAMGFDPVSGILYAAVIDERGGNNELLIQVNPTTGKLVYGAFGGDDYIEIDTDGAGLPNDIDDLAIDADGTMYAIANNGGGNDRLITINKTTGAVTDIGVFNDGTDNVEDLEGMTITHDGRLFVSSGTTNIIWEVDKSNAIVTQFGTFTNGDDYEGIACDYKKGDISGHLYNDLNRNGTQDAGEPNLANVDVVITDTFGAVTTVQTNANGDYLASDIYVGNALVDINQSDPDFPIGVFQTEGGDPTTVTVIADTNTFEENNGFNIPGTLTGHLYNDLNGNGIQDAGEPNLENITVTVTDVNGVDHVATTGTDGNYTVSNLGAGNTTVNIDQNDPDFPTGASQTEGTDPTTVTVAAGNNTEENNGFIVPGTLTGHIYNDVNGNGVQDAGENDRAGVNVLIIDANGSTQTVTTGADGNYTATGLSAGDATANIDETTLPAGSVQTEGTDPTTVTIAPGANIEENNGFHIFVAPTAVDDTEVNPNPATPANPTTLSTIDNDTDPENDINASTVNITTAGATDTDGDGDNDSLVVPGEGTWTVDNTTGDITFTPEAGFTGDPTPITYNVTDNTGLTSNDATETVDYPQTAPTAVDDNKTGTTGNPVTLTPVNDNGNGVDTDPENDINASSVILTSSTVPGATIAPDGKTVTVPGEGNWTVAANGDVTFTPEATFTGDPTPVGYTVDDNTGLTSNEAFIGINYNQTPAIAVVKVGTLNDGGDGVQAGDTISYEFNVTNTGNVPLSNVTVDDARIGVSNLAVSDLAVGAWDIVTASYTLTAQDITDGNVTNQATASGTSAQGVDVNDSSDDNSPTEDDPTVTTFTTVPPVAVDDNETGVVGQSVTLNTVGNDSDTNGDLDLTTVELNASTAPGAVIAPDGKSATVPGEGNWTVDPITGDITFTPEAGFTGDPTPIDYTVQDSAGNTSNVATESINYNQNSHVFDPPSATKTANAAGWPEVEWKMVWINDGNENAINVHVEDPLAEDVIFVSGTLRCVTEGNSTTDANVTGCYYNVATRTVIWNGNIAADLGNHAEDTANNEVVITFRTTVPKDINEIKNQGLGYWDQDGDGNVDYDRSVDTDNPLTRPSGDPTIVKCPNCGPVCPPPACPPPPCTSGCTSSCTAGQIPAVPVVSGLDGVTITPLGIGESLVGYSQGAHGSVYLDDGGTPNDPTDDLLRYVPDAGFSGSDEFTYTIVNSDGSTITKTQKVQVQNNDVRAEGITINPLADGGSLISFTQPVHGIVTLDDGGTPEDLTDDLLRYVPEAGYSGTDAFTYTIVDRNGDTVTETFTLTVDGNKHSDNGDALGKFSIMLMILLTSLLGLYYVRKEEENMLVEKEIK